MGSPSFIPHQDWVSSSSLSGGDQPLQLHAPSQLLAPGFQEPRPKRRIPLPCLPGLSAPGSPHGPVGDVSLEGREEEEETLETLPGAMAQAAAGQANAHSAGSLQTSLLKYLQWYLTNDQQAYHLSG